jgi:hypothetical protein
MIHAKGTGFIREYISNARLDPPKSLMIAQEQIGNSKDHTRGVVREQECGAPKRKAPE